MNCIKKVWVLILAFLVSFSITDINVEKSVKGAEIDRSIIINNAYHEYALECRIGESIRLCVNATSTAGRELVYTWCGDNDSIIYQEGSDYEYCVEEVLRGYNYYSCTISDGYYTEMMEFYIYGVEKLLTIKTQKTDAIVETTTIDKETTKTDSAEHITKTNSQTSANKDNTVNLKADKSTEKTKKSSKVRRATIKIKKSYKKKLTLYFGKLGSGEKYQIKLCKSKKFSNKKSITKLVNKKMYTHRFKSDGKYFIKVRVVLHKKTGNKYGKWSKILEYSTKR